MELSDIRNRIEVIIDEIPEIELVIVFEIPSTQIIAHNSGKENVELIVQESMKLARHSHKFLITLDKGKLSDLFIMSQFGVVQILGQSQVGAIIILTKNGKAQFALSNRRVRELLNDITKKL